MPRDIPTYSVCAGPGVAQSHKQLGGIAGFLTNLILYNTGPGVAFLLTILIGLILVNSPYLWFATGLTLIAGLNELKDWYYNTRLLCVSERECAIGVLITRPRANFDGDRKINLMVAPTPSATGSRPCSTTSAPTRRCCETTPTSTTRRTTRRPPS